ncbi:MAG: DUF983 domain-containing protein [Flavobacteriales bacterium]|nr:DUF983 domain-containing protein [Flavobacteriales bacterium]
MIKLKKGTKLYSVLKFKCPHCHEGEFFKDRNPYNLNVMSATHEYCPSCKRKLSIEPGFYYGAMYVSYALGVAHVVTFWVAKLILGIETEFWNFIIFVGSFLLLLTPLYYALSKIIWANMFMKYKGDQNEKS